jgi:streptogrisin B
MRRPFLITLATVALLAGAATPAIAQPAAGAPVGSAHDLLRGAQTPGIAWVVDPVTGRTTVTMDDSVTAGQATALRASAHGANIDFRREPGRLSTLLAGGDAIYGSGNRCSRGANAHIGTTYYVITAGHCTNSSYTWFVNSTQTIAIGTRTASSFPTTTTA